MAIRSQFTELMQRDMYAWFLEKYDTFAPVYPQVFSVQTMVGGFDQSTSGLALGKLSERNEGDQIIASNLLEGFTVYCKARTFSDSYWMTMEFVEDTPPEKIANILRNYATTWGEGVIATKETFFSYKRILLGSGFFSYKGIIKNVLVSSS